MGVRFLLMDIMKILIGILCLSSSFVFREMQQEIREAVADATNRFKARHPNLETSVRPSSRIKFPWHSWRLGRRHFRSWRSICRLRIQEMEMHSWSKLNIITRAGSTTRRWTKRSCGTCRLVGCGLRLRPNGWKGGIKVLLLEKPWSSLRRNFLMLHFKSG